MADWIDLTGKTALVTGSSRGIGAAILKSLAAHGATCIVNYVEDDDQRNRADAESVSASIPGSRIVACDVGDDDQVAAMMAQVRTWFGGLDLLINNAGILRDRTLKKMTTAEWDAVLRVNLSGAFHCLHHAADLLRPEARVVSISSVSGQLGLFGQANYASSKAGLIALTRVAARELAPRQITVNAIAPGFIDTEMSRNMPAAVAKQFLEHVPLARLGTVQDIADAVLFLCSPHASYITGQVLNVNGGFHMS